MPRALLVTLGLAAALLAPATAAAQSIPSPFRFIEPTQSVAPFVGYLLTDRGDFGTGPHSGPVLGARYTIRFSGPLSGEVGVGMFPTQRTVFERVQVSADSMRLDPLADVGALLLLAEAGLRFHVTGPRTWNGLAPFLALSGGIVGDARREHGVEEALESSQRVRIGPAFAVGVGAGTDLFLSERLSVRLEARDHLWRLTHPQGFTGTDEDETQWTHNLGVTFGVALHF